MIASPKNNRGQKRLPINRKEQAKAPVSLE
jgi:hypothetical protein